MFWWVLGFSTLGSIGGIAGTFVFLWLPTKLVFRLLPYLLSYAAGTLLTVAWFGLLPQALESTHDHYESVLLTVLGGTLFFFFLEKFLCSHEHHEIPQHDHDSMGPLVLLGNGIHNFLDGIVIGAAFVVSIPLGMATSLAIVAHALPHQIGNFVMLLESGFSKQKAFITNLFSSLTMVLGALLAFYGLSAIEPVVPYLLAVAASSFLYLATAHLLPSLNKRHGLREALLQVVLMGAGVATILLAHPGGAHHGQ